MIRQRRVRLRLIKDDGSVVEGDCAIQIRHPSKPPIMHDLRSRAGARLNFFDGRVELNALDLAAAKAASGM